MNPRERGFLLLTSRLGNPDRQVLSTAQLRMLALRLRGRECAQPEREMTRQDFIELGYDRETAERYSALLSDTEQLDYYLSRGRKMDCNPVTRVSEEYPGILRQRLVMDAPGCLWAKGDLSILAPRRLRWWEAGSCGRRTGNLLRRWDTGRRRKA